VKNILNKMKKIFTIDHKNILVTGASSGIGRQCAISASRLGANVIMIARNIERLNETMSLMENGNHIVVDMDITDFEKIPDIIEESVKRIGKISGFIHSAGIEITLPLKYMKKEHYEKMMLINVLSGFEFIKVLSNTKYFDEKGASFVIISSVMSMVGRQGIVGYCASKGAINAGIKPMALELAAKKIRVNSVCPGIVETEMSIKMFENIPDEARKKIVDMHPLGIGHPEDIANMCLFLISDQSRWITGTNIVIDGGYSAH